MNRLKNVLLFVMSAFILLAAFAAISPKRAHAVVATLVQVANTATNPVLNRDIDRADSEPFATTLCYGSGGFYPCYLGQEMPSEFSVPATTSDGSAVKELVIDYADGNCYTTAGGTLLDVDLATTVSENTVNSVGSSYHFFPLQQNPNITASNQGHIFSWSTPTRIFADPGTTVLLIINSNIDTNFGCSMNLTGHLAKQ
jgi:hypothetical protein